MRFFVNLTCELSRKLRKNPKKNQDFAAFLRVSNFYYFAARASPASSLVPLKSLVEALFNGARLEVGGARGADFWLFENTRKHAKSRTTILHTCKFDQICNRSFQTWKSFDVMHCSAHMHRFPPCLFDIHFGFHAKLSGLPIFKLWNDPYVTA